MMFDVPTTGKACYIKHSKWAQQAIHKRFNLLTGPNDVTLIPAFLWDQTSFQMLQQTGCQYVNSTKNPQTTVSCQYGKLK